MSRLINWLWLEELLVRGCEAEIRAFGEGNPDARFFAACLEFDGLRGELSLSYGTRDAVERARERLGSEGPAVQYRAVELRPQNWRYRAVPREDATGAWECAAGILEAYRANMNGEASAGEAEFCWLRFEYLCESVVARLWERGVFSALRCEPQFIAYAANEQESLEEVEDRLEKLYPLYRRATSELVERPRPRGRVARACQNPECRQPGSRAALSQPTLLRCTACQRWLCGSCGDEHAHPELYKPLPFFHS